MSAVEAAARVRQHGRSERAALGVFIVGCLAAFAFYALYLGARLYVGGDDLLLLSERPPGFLDAALSAFVAHWSTLPHLVGRVVYELFGFRSGMAWTAVGTACWIATAVMVRVLSRQAGTGPWIATTAGLAVLTCIDIYPPTQPLTYQVPMAVACGLAACAVANRACLPWAWLLGLLAIMSSAAGVPFVVSAASILWLRGGTKRAGLYAATLGGIFLLWYLGYGPQPVEMPFSVWDEPPTALLQWMLTGLGAGFTALGHWRVLAALLLLATVVGAFRVHPRRELLPVLAVAVAGVLHLVLAYVLRFWVGAEASKHSRFLYVTVATLLPLIALGLQALARSWMPLRVVPLVLVLGAIGNMGELPGAQRKMQEESLLRSQQMVQLARTPQIDQVPGWVVPHPSVYLGDGLNLTTADFLRRARDDGALPESLPWNADYQQQVPVRLGFVHTYEPVPADAQCLEQSAPVTLDLSTGSRVGLQGGLFSGHPFVLVSRQGDPGSSVAFVSGEPGQFEILAPGPYVLSSAEEGQPFVLCRW